MTVLFFFKSHLADTAMLCDINGVDTAKWEDTHEIIELSVFVVMVWLWRENWRRVKRWKNRGNNKDRKKITQDRKRNNKSDAKKK